jgi:hypothetical protein
MRIFVRYPKRIFDVSFKDSSAILSSPIVISAIGPFFSERRVGSSCFKETLSAAALPIAVVVVIGVVL